MVFLDKDINSNIKKLNIEQLQVLSSEIRDVILKTTTDNGGHLSSNLGFVDTTVALYKYFDFDIDRLIFDVGHQCYPHKILSGRLNDFSSIRKEGGLSGFPNPEESKFDTFAVGHSGTSISTALGLCEARDRQSKDYYVIAVCGDGSIVNGLNLEAISGKADKPKKLIVILNDNGMSISKNQNGLYKYISKKTLQKGYVKGKKAIKRIFGSSFITRGLSRFRDFLKRIVYNDNYFEKFGFKYVGVVDGNNIKELNKILPKIKELSKDKAVLLHIKTTKGKGFSLAEQNAEVYHGVGKNLINTSGDFGDALGKAINSEIEKDDKIISITAGMKDGTGLKKVEETHPKNFLDVGIAEEYALSLSAGLAKGGLKPIVAIYSTFMQRGYDQIVHDICLNNLPVVMCIDRAGFVGEDGKTHQGLFDLSYLSHIPNLTILTPSSSKDIPYMLSYALQQNSPVVIRYPKNDCDIKVDGQKDSQSFYEKLTDDGDIAILAVGPNSLKTAIEVKNNFDKKVMVVAVRKVKPLDENFLKSIKDKVVVTIEENSLIGGFGSEVCRFFAREGKTKVLCFGVKDNFVSHGKTANQLKNNGIDYTNIIKEMEKVIL